MGPGGPLGTSEAPERDDFSSGRRKEDLTSFERNSREWASRYALSDAYNARHSSLFSIVEAAIIDRRHALHMSSYTESRNACSAHLNQMLCYALITEQLDDTARQANHIPGII